MVPRRDQTTVALLAEFRACMSQQQRQQQQQQANMAHPLVCIDEGTVPCQDDWGDGDAAADDNDETPAVECWWGIFARRLHSPG